MTVAAAVPAATGAAPLLSSLPVLTVLRAGIVSFAVEADSTAAASLLPLSITASLHPTAWTVCAFTTTPDVLALSLSASACLVTPSMPCQPSASAHAY